MLIFNSHFIKFFGLLVRFWSSVIRHYNVYTMSSQDKIKENSTEELCFCGHFMGIDDHYL